MAAAATMKDSFDVARKRVLNFAFCLGKQPDTTVFITHRTKKPDALFKEARKQGETAKAVKGSMQVEGKTMLLTCLNDPPAGCAKKLKDFMKAVPGLIVKIVLIDVAGEQIEADGEDETDDATVQQPAVNPEEAAWHALKAKVSPKIEPLHEDVAGPAKTIVALWNTAMTHAREKRFAQATDEGRKVAKLLLGNADRDTDKVQKETGNPADLKLLAHQLLDITSRIKSTPQDKQGALSKAADLVAKAIRAGKAGPAQAGLSALSKALQKQEDQPRSAARPLDVVWSETSAPVIARADAILRKQPGNAQQLRAWKSAAAEKADAGDFKTANAIVRRLEKLLARAETAVNQGVVNKIDFTKTRLEWSTARSKLRIELQRLAAEINQQCDPAAFKNYDSKKVENDLIGYIAPIDSKLESALDLLIGTSEPPRRAVIKTKCAQLAAEYRAVLRAPFFEQIDTKNGFMNLSVRASAVDALDKVDAALSAPDLVDA
ncbi:MAG: hypothetical protein AAFS01_04270 [Pseudomonadota bacterium]